MQRSSMSVASMLDECANKPPYRVPSLAEIRKLPKHGRKVVSLFSGGGGSSLGYAMAGFEVVAASEFVPAARATYSLNFPQTPIIVDDVRKVAPHDIMALTGIDVGELDVLDGSPPCASFSEVVRKNVKMEDLWGKEKEYCLVPGTRVLTKDLRWIPIEEAKVGTELIAFEEENEPGKRGRRFVTTQVESVALPTRSCSKLTFEDGSTVESSDEHRWLVTSGSNLRWKSTRSLEEGDVLLSIGTWEEETTKAAGWLAGMFDGEGCVCRSGKRRLVSIGQNRGLVLSKLQAELGARGFGWAERSDDAFCELEIRGGLPEQLRLLGSLRPARLLSKAKELWEGLNVQVAYRKKIEKIERTGRKDVIGIRTTAGTFIAEGLLSHNSGTTQRTDDLFDHYLRLLEGLKPKAFVAENVLGLSKGKAKGHFLRIVARMRAAGYRVSVALADAQWLGVPQHRERLIFLGFREDLGIEPDFPTPLLYRYSLKEALEGVVSTEEELAHVSFREHAIYPVWKKLMPGTKRPDKYFNLFRCTWEKPAPTLLATAGKVGGASICHPDEPRKFTVPELRRICSFPDDFALAGEYFHQVERMGRAVPPLMMAKVAGTIHRLFGG